VAALHQACRAGLHQIRNRNHRHRTRLDAHQVAQKGRLFIYALLKHERGLLPLIEREVAQ